MALLSIKYIYLLYFIASCTTTARLLPREALGPNDVNKETVLPGRSGWERNSQGQTDIKYGDDFLPGHMRHLERNQDKYPSNKDYMKLKGNDNDNRDAALHNIDPAPPHPMLGYDRVRDEKLPNMLDNPNHGSQTTVEYREKAESDGKGRKQYDHTEGGVRQNSGTNYVGENGLLSASKNAIQKGGGQQVGRLVPNPGWLSPDRNQRLGHEAPGRLESTPKPQDPATSAGDGGDDNSQKGRGRGKQSSRTPDKGRAGTDSSASQQSYTRERKAGDKTLRPKQSNQAPPPQDTNPQTPAPKRRKDPAGQKSNLQDGTPAKTPGRVWSAGGGGDPEVPSHAGAPVQAINPESRRPPRPQNLDAYKQQLSEQQQKDDAAAKAQTKAEHGASALNTDLGEKHKNDQKYQANLSKFNQDHPVQAPGKASEAPGRLQGGPSRPQHPVQAPEHAQEPWTPNRNPAPVRPQQHQEPSTPLAIRPRPGPAAGHTGSDDVHGPSTPPQRSEPPAPVPRRGTRDRTQTKRLRRRWLEYVLEQELLNRRDFYYL